MPDPIGTIRAVSSAVPSMVPLESAASATGASGSAFQSFLSDAIGRVEQVQQTSNAAVDKFLSGEDQEVHKVALATQQASLTFDLFMQVRNKVVAAYQEVMRMQM